MMSYGMEHVFRQFGSAVLAISPPSLLPKASLVAFEGKWGDGVMALMLWENFSIATKHWCVMNNFLDTNKEQHYEGFYGES